MSKLRYVPVNRKTISGDFDFEKYISLEDIYNLNQQSYDDFLQKDVPINQRKNKGLEKVFRKFFPVIHRNKIQIEYEGYHIANPRITPEDCSIRG
ncbi:MAG: hypothetical protein ACK5XN_01530, partial [Bacteroidota bacterium]